jgi:hypothetical protein
MRPAWGDLERPGRAPQVWRRSQHAFHSNVVGPHFEEICRQWTRWLAGPQTYGGAYPVRVTSGTVSDPEARKTAEVDVAVFGRSEDDRDVLLAIGEAKWQGVRRHPRRRRRKAKHRVPDLADQQIPDLSAVSGATAGTAAAARLPAAPALPRPAPPGAAVCARRRPCPVTAKPSSPGEIASARANRRSTVTSVSGVTPRSYRDT